MNVIGGVGSRSQQLKTPRQRWSFLLLSFAWLEVWGIGFCTASGNLCSEELQSAVQCFSLSARIDRDGSNWDILKSSILPNHTALCIDSLSRKVTFFNKKLLTPLFMNPTCRVYIDLTNVMLKSKFIDISDTAVWWNLWDIKTVKRQSAIWQQNSYLLPISFIIWIFMERDTYIYICIYLCIAIALALAMDGTAGFQDGCGRESLSLSVCLFPYLHPCVFSATFASFSTNLAALYYFSNWTVYCIDVFYCVYSYLFFEVLLYRIGNCFRTMM